MQPANARRREGRSKATLHPPFDCHMLLKRLSPLYKWKNNFLDIFSNFRPLESFLLFVFCPSLPLELTFCVPSPNIHNFLALLISFDRIQASRGVLCSVLGSLVQKKRQSSPGNSPSECHKDDTGPEAPSL